MATPAGQDHAVCFGDEGGKRAFAVETLKAEIGNAAVKTNPPAAQSEAQATPPRPAPPAAAIEPPQQPAATAPAPAPTSAAATDRPRSDAEVLLAQLLDRQNKLAEDISEAGEAAYRKVCDEIAKVSALITEENHAR